MTRRLILAALLLGACSNAPPNAPLGQFTAPGGVAATGAADRDVLFIANSARDGLRALQFCNKSLLADGGLDPTDTCPGNENGQFVPAPIRVFPATVETGDRPIRVAGVRLGRPDGTGAGVALVVGAESTLAVVDARSLVDAQKVPNLTPRPVQYVDLGALGVDVVAANPVDSNIEVETAAPAVTAFAATETELLMLDVRLGTDGFAQLPTIRGRCTLAPVVPTKIAIVPGSADQVFVADGAGDGVVRITAAAIVAGGACVTDRISAGNRPVRSVALSPQWYETITDTTGAEKAVTHPPGELLMMVVEPAAAPDAGQDLDPGGVLIARTGLVSDPTTDPPTPETKGIVPIPPFALVDATKEPMQPLALGNSGPPAVSTAGLLREAAFLRAVKPRNTAPVPPDLKICTAAPCTPLYVGTPGNAPQHLFDLLAAVSATDGATYFVDVPNRRFVNSNFYLSDASLVPGMTSPLFNPALAAQPTLTIDPLSLQPGVTHTTFWRAIWHSAIPGLERRGGIVAPAGNGNLKVTFPGVDLGPWQADSAILFAPGDVVSFGAYQVTPANPSADCQALAASETAYRFELPILSVPAADSLEVSELADTPDQRGFHLGSCAEIGVVAEVRTGGSRPWLVFESATVQGRVAADRSFVARQRRFDYPLSAYSAGDANTPPQAAQVNDFAFRFSIAGPDPTIAHSVFTWTTTSSQAPVLFGDALAPAGFATAVYPYSSPRTASLVFTSVTGANELLQADPAVLQGNIATGILAYR